MRAMYFGKSTNNALPQVRAALTPSATLSALLLVKIWQDGKQLIGKFSVIIYVSMVNPFELEDVKVISLRSLILSRDTH